MILVAENEFRLQTARTSYWFRVTPFGHLEHVYYGPRLPEGATSLPEGATVEWAMVVIA